LTAPQSFIISAHAFGELRRHGISVDRDQRVGRLTAAHFFGDPIAQLIDWLRHKGFQLIPVGHFRMSFEFFAGSTNAIANPRCLCPQFRIVEQFLDVAHPIRPLPESFAGDRSAGASTKLAIGAALTIRAASPPQRICLPALLLPLAPLAGVAAL
jgi:hypothetical protein